MLAFLGRKMYFNFATIKHFNNLNRFLIIISDFEILNINDYLDPFATS